MGSWIFWIYDADNDGILDYFDDDADGDGLSNEEEILNNRGNWLDADSDNDGTQMLMIKCPLMPMKP